MFWMREDIAQLINELGKSITLRRMSVRNLDNSYGSSDSNTVADEIIKAEIQFISEQDVKLMGPGWVTKIGTPVLYAKVKDNIQVHDRVMYNSVWYEVISKNATDYYNEHPVIEVFELARLTDRQYENPPANTITGDY